MTTIINRKKIINTQRKVFNSKKIFQKKKINKTFYSLNLLFHKRTQIT